MDITSHSVKEDFRKSVFISHASKDFKIANEIRELLEADGVSSWIAPRDIPPGYQYGTAIIEAIKDCTITLLVLTDDSNKSKAVENEIERAFSYQKTIVPIRLRDLKPSSQLEFFISNAQWVDAFISPLKYRVKQIASIVHAIEFNQPAPVPIPEIRTISGTLELYLERAFRHKVLSVATGFSVLLLLSIGIFLLQFSSRGDLSGATNAISRSADKIGVAATTIEQTSSTIKHLDAKVDQVKKETSSDPRKELANRGIQWTQENLAAALKSSDLETVSLFMDGNYNLHSGSIPMSIADLFERENFTSKIKLLELMRSKGFDFLVEFKNSDKGDYGHRHTPLNRASDRYKPNLDGIRWLLDNNNKSILHEYNYIVNEEFSPDKVWGVYNYCEGNDDFFKIYSLLTNAGVSKDSMGADNYKIAYRLLYEFTIFKLPQNKNDKQLILNINNCQKFVDFLRPQTTDLRLKVEQQAKDQIKKPILDDLLSSLKILNREISSFEEMGIKGNQMVQAYNDHGRPSLGIARSYQEISLNDLRAKNSKESDSIRNEIRRVSSL